MPIEGIVQPEIWPVDGEIRLRRFDGVFDFALEWYQDPELVWMVDGVREPYTPEKLARMYAYLEKAGELYFIEALEDGRFVPIGDVTLWQEDMPIVIGNPEYRGRGVGRRVVRALVERGRELGFSTLHVDQIYHYNIPSQTCFERAGFRQSGRTEKGVSYELDLTEV